MKKQSRKEKNQGMNWIRKEKRLAIYMRDGMACAYCGRTVEDGVQLSLDHVIPYSAGGSNSEKNLVTCCSHCNSVRQDRPIEKWAKDVAGYMNVSPAAVLGYIRKQTGKSLKQYKTEAKELMARRASWAECLKK